MSGLLERLHRVLAGTAETPRRVARLELPFDAGHLLGPEAVQRLQPAAVLVPVIAHAAGATILLTRRADTLRQHKGQVSFPGGRLDETDSNMTAAALREAHEEVGLDPAGVQVIGYLDDYPTFTGYRITPVVGVVREAFTPVTHPGEVAATFELPMTTLLSEGAFERKAFTRDGLTVPFFELNYGEHRIWGATAGILWELRGRLCGDG
ncbi:MAG: CoA pyrophosphatase [Nevskia sp.]|nr:CoA pyrophosphatase [Nevskia sp.]